MSQSGNGRKPSTESGPSVPQLEQVCNLIELHKRPIQLLPRVPRRNAEPRPRHQDGHGGEAHDDHREAALEALAREGGNLRGVVQHHRHNGTVVVTQDVQAHVGQAHSEVVRVVAQGVELLPSDAGAVLAHDDLKERHCSECT